MTKKHLPVNNNFYLPRYSWNEKYYLTVLEMAEFLNVGRNTAYNLIHMEGFPINRIGRKVMIPRDKLIEWIDNGGASGCNEG